MDDDVTFSQRIIGTGLLSASALFLEIALTRLFSTLYFPPYVFFIISFAILGIGLGAALCALIPALRKESRIALYAAGASLTTLILVGFAVLTVAYEMQIVLFALLIVPYVFVGLALSAIFSQYGTASHLLYMGDLVGAGVGAILLIPILNAFGAINGVMVASLGFAIATLYFSTRGTRLISIVTIALSVLILGSNVALDWLTVDMGALATDKPITQVLKNGGELLQTRWDSFARTDLVRPSADELPRIYVDGGAASIMPRAGQNPNLVRDIGFFPFATDQPEQVFIVGPGGGLDVWFALQTNAQNIVGVEVNAASVALVEELGSFNGGLYDQPNVTITVNDARSVLAQSDAQYDLIYLSQVVTLVAERGGYALSENTIYTVEAFETYFSHLTDEGQIALKLYDEITLTRAVSTALSALGNRGLSDAEAMKHLLILLDVNANPPIPLLLVRNTAFSEDDSLVFGAIANDVGFTPMYLPHVYVQPPLDAVDEGTAPFSQIVADSSSDISASTDDRPYFFQFERGVPTTLQPLLAVVLALSALGIFLYAWVLMKSHDIITRSMPPYFAMLGIGFIMLEIYAIQQTRLFLGHPTFAVTLVLVTFLVGGGLGSGLSQRALKPVLDHNPHWIPAIIVILFMLWMVVWGLVSPALISSDLWIRGLFIALTFAPIGLFMGMLFPYGLRLVDQKESRLVAVGWAVNGVATVVGSVLAVVISITVGFRAVLLIGLIAYGVASVLLYILQRNRSS